MGMDVGKVTIDYLPRPAGLAYKFIEELACSCGCVGDGNALGFYERSEMEEKAKEFTAKEFPTGNPLAEDILKDWISTLPWDEDNCLTLHFNW